MSAENVEMVRSGFSAYNRGDIDAVMDVCHPDVVFETLLMGTHRGRESLRRLYEENQESLSGYQLDAEEVIDLGDRVVAVVRLGGAGPVTQIALNDAIAFLITVEDGAVVRQQSFRNKQAALDAAGATRT